MPYDAEATRARLVGAAIVEFSEHGLAGARVDRIASRAAANKRAIYDYFGNKDGLYEAALNRVVDELIETVPLSEDNLPRYAAELFDYLQAHPEAVRLLAWQRLERPRAGARVADAFLERMTAVRDRARAAGSAHVIDAVDLVILTIGLANAWQLSAPDLLASQGEDPTDAARIAQHRSAVIEAARRISSGA